MTVIVVAVVALATTTMAQRLSSEPGQTIAQTLLEFVHTCTPMQRLELRAIIEEPDATWAERTVAAALLGVIHTPDPDDLQSLQQIAHNPVEPLAIRRLAAIVAHLVHIPSEMDRAELSRMLCEVDFSTGEVPPATVP